MAEFANAFPIPPIDDIIGEEIPIDQLMGDDQDNDDNQANNLGFDLNQQVEPDEEGPLNPPWKNLWQ